MEELELAKEVCRLVIEYDKRSTFEARQTCDGVRIKIRSHRMLMELVDKACAVLGVPRHDSYAVGEPQDN